MSELRMPARVRGRGDVLHLAIEDNVRGGARYPQNGAEEVEQDFEPVTPEVEHRSSAGFGGLDEPVPRLARGLIEVLEDVDLGQHRPADLP